MVTLNCVGRTLMLLMMLYYAHWFGALHSHRAVPCITLVVVSFRCCLPACLLLLRTARTASASESHGRPLSYHTHCTRYVLHTLCTFCAAHALHISPL